MRFLGLEITQQKKKEKRGDPALDDRYWTTIIDKSLSGVWVTPETAERQSAVYSCVKIISETIATLPLILYRRMGERSKERAVDHPLYPLLNFFPNTWSSRVEFIETIVRQLLLRGNAYAFKQGDYNSLQQLLLLDPDKMNIKSNRAPNGTLELLYNYSGDQGIRVLTQSEIVHVRGPSDDTIMGKGPIQRAREVIGLAIALENHSSTGTANASRLSGVLEHPELLTDEVSERIAKSWRDQYSGSTNSGKVAVLEEGMTFKPISMTNADAQFIESRKMSRSEVAGLFSVPPHLIGDLQFATFSNIEHQNIAFAVHTIRPWTVRIEQAFNRDLLKPAGIAEEYFFEFLIDGLLRGDIQTRYEAYKTGVNNGFLSPNDVREMENKNYVEGGDIYLVPLNMTTLDKAGQAQVKPTEPVAEVEPQDEPDEEDDQRKFKISLEATKESYRKLFFQAFRRIYGREFSSLAPKIGKLKRGRFDEWLTEFFIGHRDFVQDSLTGTLDSFNEQIILLGNICSVKITPLKQEFITNYLANYIGERFDRFYTDTGPEILNSFSNIPASSKTKADQIVDEIIRLMVNEE